MLFRCRQDASAHLLMLGYTIAGWLGSFVLMGSESVALNIIGLLLCTHTMVLAAYLIHEAAHQTLFATARANRRIGEVMNFIAGSSYASFERIRQLHIRHHLERADLVCFDFKSFMQRHPAVMHTVQALEWAYIPAAEILMHLQVVLRPFRAGSHRQHLPRVITMLLVRGALLASLWYWSPRAALIYGLAVLIELHVLNFFDAFHHTFAQYVVTPDQPITLDGRDRAYEQTNTYSNLISLRHPWLNALVLNFGYHNAHHHRPSVPWWRLPTLHRDLCGEETPATMPVRELLATWHRHRVRRVFADDYGTIGAGPRRADSFIGAHGVSFLTVV
jgi:fatty acid desaturase